jgi:hypothetical protein
VVKLDEIVSRAAELFEQYQKKTVEYAEAEQRYGAILPVFQALTPGQDLQPQSIDLEQAQRLWESVEQKRREREKALQKFWEFREQHRNHLIAKGFLK